MRPLLGGVLNAYGQAPQSSLCISPYSGPEGLKRASGAGPKLAPILAQKGSRRGPKWAPFWASLDGVQPDSLKQPSRGGPSEGAQNRGPRALFGPYFGPLFEGYLGLIHGEPHLGSPEALQNRPQNRAYFEASQGPRGPGRALRPSGRPWEAQMRLIGASEGLLRALGGLWRALGGPSRAPKIGLF